MAGGLLAKFFFTSLMVIYVFKNYSWEFPGDPEVKRTFRFHCWSPHSIPGQGTKILQATLHG